jgi:hypothetical protein
VSLNESPETAAEIMGGAAPDLVQGAGHEADACPDAVHVRATELGEVCVAVKFAGLCALRAVVFGGLPQAQKSARAIPSVNSRRRTCLMVIERCRC